MLSRRAMINDEIVSEQGNNLLLQKCKGSYLHGLNIYGHSTQQTTTGAQLYDADDVGGKFPLEADADGWYTIEHDSVEKNTIYKNVTVAPNGLIYEEAGTQYAVVLEIASIENCGIAPLSNYTAGDITFIPQLVPAVGNYVRYEIGTYVFLADINNNENIDCMLRTYIIVNENAVGKCRFRLSVLKDTTVIAETFKYEPFTGGYPSPSPDYPQEIVSAGDSGNIDISVIDGAEAAQALTISTPNGLPGIPVSSGGNYIDSNGQQWICDEIDFLRGKYVKRIIAINTLPQLVGTTEEKWRLAFHIYSSSLDGMGSGANNFVMANNMQVISQSQEKAKEYPVLAPYGHSDRCELRYWMPKTMYSTSEEAIEAASGIVYYPQRSPIETDLTAKEIAAYKSIHTYTPTTKVTNDADAWMKIGYRKVRG